jgi:hypothetical protein
LQKKFKNDYYNIANEGAFGGVERLVDQQIKPMHKKDVKDWLPTQLTYSLHKPLRKKFPTRKYRTSGLNDLWQMDLMEMIPYSKVNKNFKYILTCIDVFSRFAYAIPIKTKSGLEVKEAIEKMVKEASAPRHVQTDLGKEFYNSHVQAYFKKQNINHYSVNSQFKAALVERFNRTLREKLNRYFTYSGEKIWYQILPSIIDTYNRTKHRGIFNMRPIDITPQTEIELWKMQEEGNAKKSTKRKNEIPLMNYVRISKIVNSPFKKNFDQNWSDEVFRVIKIDTSVNPSMYVIEDMDKQIIVGKFYKEELQDIGNTPPEVFRIEKIIKTKGIGKHKQHWVKWVGYNNTHNSWVSAFNLIKT